MIATAEPTTVARTFTVTMPYSVFALADQFTAPKGHSRPVLKCVCLDLSKGFAIAADGFQLAKVPIEIEADGEIARKSTVLIHRDDFARAKKITKRNTSITLGITNFASDGIGVSVNFLGDNNAFLPAEAQPGTFPDVDQIIPRDRDDEVTITLSPDLVASLVALAKAENAIIPRIALRVPSDPLQPVVSTLPSGAVALTMPMEPDRKDR